MVNKIEKVDLTSAKQVYLTILRECKSLFIKEVKKKKVLGFVVTDVGIQYLEDRKMFYLQAKVLLDTRDYGVTNSQHLVDMWVKHYSEDGVEFTIDNYKETFEGLIRKRFMGIYESGEVFSTRDLVRDGRLYILKTISNVEREQLIPSIPAYASDRQFSDMELLLLQINQNVEKSLNTININRKSAYKLYMTKFKNSDLNNFLIANGYAKINSRNKYSMNYYVQAFSNTVIFYTVTHMYICQDGIVIKYYDMYNMTNVERIDMFNTLFSANNNKNKYKNMPYYNKILNNYSAIYSKVVTVDTLDNIIR